MATDAAFELRNRKIVVTGGTGHVGVALVARLNEIDIIPTLVGFGSPHHLKAQKFTWIPGNIIDSNTLDEAFNGADVVVHLAALIGLCDRDYPAMVAVNELGTQNVVNACLKNKVKRVVHFSSTHVFSPQPDESFISESTSMIGAQGEHCYDLTKANADRIVQDAIRAGLPANVICPCAILGPFDTVPSSIGRYLTGTLKRRLQVVIAGGYTWVDVRDIINATLQCIIRGGVGERYVLGGRYATVQELVQMCNRVTNHFAIQIKLSTKIARKLVVPLDAIFSLLGRGGLATRFAVDSLKTQLPIDSTKAQRDLDYRCRPLEETLRDAVNYYRLLGII